MKTFLTSFRKISLTLIAVAVAVFAGRAIWVHYMDDPWTRDGRVRADVVQVAPDVSGFISEVLAHDNQRVERGQVLLRLDTARFDLALKNATAVVSGRKAALDQAEADLKRYQSLSDRVVTQQKLEDVTATQLSAKAAYDQAITARDLAQLDLDRSEVRAPVSGTVSNMNLVRGTYVSAGKGVMALVDENSLHIDGYFEETKLSRIRIGDPVVVHLMGDIRPITGHVESIAAGIEDRDRSAGSSLLADVNPTFSWVRLPQRVPVRITLDPASLKAPLVAGSTATVEIRSLPPARSDPAANRTAGLL